MKIILNKKIRLTKVYTWLVIAAFLYTLGVQVFIQVARIFPSGLGAFAVMPTFIWPQLTAYVTWIYLGLNLPLIIIFWYKNSRKFMTRTLFFLIVQAAFGTFFSIPYFQESIHDILNTGATTNVALRKMLWPILVLGIIGGIFMGGSIGIAWKFGGSSGGTDIITYYWSTKKKGDIGILLFITSTLCVLISFIFSIIFASDMRETWVMSLFTSLVYILFTSLIVNKIYPKYKKVCLVIVSQKPEEIGKEFQLSEFNHAWQYSKFISGISGQEKTKISTVVYLLECRDLIRKIKTIDNTAWISMYSIHSVVGHLDATVVENKH